VVFSPNAWEEFQDWLREDVRIARRVGRLIGDVRRNPYGMGIGKPEMLKGPLAGLLSRRIDGEHRLIYRMRGDALEIVACYGHYDGK
jgi:toxin YoeB